MKTIYCTMNAHAAKIILTDDILCRIKTLEDQLKTLSEPKQGILKDNEAIMIELSYGTFKVTPPDENGNMTHIPTAEGPVLVYGNDTCIDHKMRCADDVVSIIIRPEESTIECMGCDGMEYPLFPEQSLSEIPDVFFSNDFIHHMKSPLFKDVCADIVEDMPKEHRDILQSHLTKEMKYGE